MIMPKWCSTGKRSMNGTFNVLHALLHCCTSINWYHVSWPDYCGVFTVAAIAMISAPASDDEGSTAATDGSTLRTSPADHGGSVGSESGGSAIDSVAGEHSGGWWHNRHTYFQCQPDIQNGIHACLKSEHKVSINQKAINLYKILHLTRFDLFYFSLKRSIIMTFIWLNSNLYQHSEYTILDDHTWYSVQHFLPSHLNLMFW